MTTETTQGTDAAVVPSTMLAWQVPALGEPEAVMTLQDLGVPEPGPGEVLVDIWSTGLNFPDALLVRGRYQEKPDLPFTPGLELCGEVVAVGPGVGRHRLGERVIGLPKLPHGALAQFAVCRADDVLPAPSALDDAEASVFHIAYQTGWFGLYRRAAVRVGETVLVHAAAGGAGSAAVQLARAAGAHVIAVVGSADKVQVARDLGAEVVVDRSSEDVVTAVKEATHGRGVEVVYDPVGGAAFEASTKVIAFEGRIVVVGFASGAMASAATNHVLIKNYSVLGLHWNLYRQHQPEAVRRAADDLDRLAEAGALRPLLSERVEFEDAAHAIARIAAGTTTGRIAVTQP